MLGKLLRKLIGIPELDEMPEYELPPIVTTSFLGADKFSIDWKSFRRSDKVKVQMHAAKKLYSKEK